MDGGRVLEGSKKLMGIERGNLKMTGNEEEKEKENEKATTHGHLVRRRRPADEMTRRDI